MRLGRIGSSRIGIAAASLSLGAASWLTLGRLTVTDAANPHRIGLLPPVWLLVTLVVLASVVTTLMARRGWSIQQFFLGLLIVLPWLPVPLPNAVLAFNGPAVWSVWTAIVLCGIIGSPAGSLLARAIQTFNPRAAPYLAGSIAVAVVLLLRYGQWMPPTGDEPHYLLIAQSIVLDHDLRVANNYERHDYESYYGGPLQPHLPPAGWPGQEYSFHAPGLPILIAPAFALGGYRFTVLLMAILTGLGTAFVWKAGYELTGDRVAAWLGWATVAVTVPVALMGTLIYPDPVAGVVLACVVLVLTRTSINARGAPPPLASRSPSLALEPQALRAGDWPLGLASTAILGIAVGALPWFHSKLALPALLAGAILVARMRSISCRLAFVASFAACVIGWLAFWHSVYGSFNLAAPYGGDMPLSARNLEVGLSGLLADQEFGLLWNAPVHLVSLGGLIFLFRRNQRIAIELLLLVLPYAVATAAYPLWWAGFSPPARYLTTVILPLGVAASAAWAGMRPALRTLSGALLGLSALITVALSFGGGGVLAYNVSTGRARWLDWVSPMVNLASSFPTVTSRNSAVPVAIWTAVALAGVLAFGAVYKVLRSAPPAHAVAATLSVALISLVAVETVWSVRRDRSIVATPSQLDLLRSPRSSRLPWGAQLLPLKLLRAEDVSTRLVLSTSPFEDKDRDTLLRLIDVPAGDYQLRVAPRDSGGSRELTGEITVNIGYASVPVERWRLFPSGGTYSLRLPIAASILLVSGDEGAIASVGRVGLAPARGPGLSVPTHETARDAGRYGSMTVYAVDTRVWLEPSGIWVMGERQPDLVLAPDDRSDSIDLELRNMPIANVVRLHSGRWSAARTLAPEERWPVRVPVPVPGEPIVLNIDVEHGIRPAYIDASSQDRRFLGCRLEFP